MQSKTASAFEKFSSAVYLRQYRSSFAIIGKRSSKLHRQKRQSATCSEGNQKGCKSMHLSSNTLWEVLRKQSINSICYDKTIVPAYNLMRCLSQRLKFFLMKRNYWVRSSLLSSLYWSCMSFLLSPPLY